MNERAFNKSRINYTQVSNDILKNNELSWGAKGLLSYMLSRPETWTFNMKEIASNSNESYGMCQKYMKELIDKKYIIRKRVGVRGTKGKFENLYFINDRPFTNDEISKILPNSEKMGTSTTEHFNSDSKEQQQLKTATVFNYDCKSGSYNNTDIYINTDNYNNTNIEREETKSKLEKEIINLGAYYQEIRMLLSQYSINYESIARIGKPIQRIRDVIKFAKENNKGDGWIVSAIKYDYKLEKYSKPKEEQTFKNPAYKIL